MVSTLGLCRAVSIPPCTPPSERVSNNGLLETTLTVKLCEVHGKGINFITRSYDGQIPGPTLRIMPGDTMQVTLRNELGSDGGVEGIPNTTNLHPHGMHVSPLEDDVFINVSSNDAHTYKIHVPKDHQQGSFYYHPHRLPGDLIQAMGGMGGMIVVEDRRTWPHELQEMKQQTVVLQKWLWCSNASDPCGWNARGHVMHSNHYWFPGSNALVGNTPVPAVTSPKDWTDVDYMTVSGEYQPKVDLHPGEYRYMRILNAAIDMQLRIQLEKPCTMSLLATDGSYLDAPRATLNNSVVLSIADRVDVAVMCPSAGTFTLRSEPFTPKQVDYMGHPGFDEHSFPDGQTLLTFHTVGPQAEHANRLPSYLPARPSYLRDYRTIPDSEIHVRHSVWMAGVPSVAGKSSPYSYAMVNGRSNPNQYTAPVEFELAQDRIEEWIIHNHPPNCTALANDTDQCTIDGGDGTVLDTGSGHVLHMHTNHFQIVRTIPPAVEGLDFAVGEFHDTVFFGHNAPTLVIRFRFANFTGPTLYHCHYAKHASQGMASKVEGAVKPCHKPPSQKAPSLMV